MNIKGLIKNILINEVGEGSHKSFRTKRDVSNFENKYRANKEKDDFTYEFTTEKNFKYSVNLRRELGQEFSYYWGVTQEKRNKEELADFYNRNRATYINLRKMGATREDFLNMWLVSFEVSEAPEEYFEDKDEKEKEEYELRDNLEADRPSEESYSTSNHPGMEIPSSYNRIRYISTGSDINQGEFFRVMATVSKIIKNHVKKYKGRIVTFSPADERRGRIFTRYILTQIPGTKSYVNNNDFYFLINT